MPSTAIRRYSYDAEERKLTIEFVTGRRYLYSDVSPRTAEGLRTATSKGGYFNRAIRDLHSFVELEPAA